MFNATLCTTDKRLELVAWARDRRAYRRACGIEDGAAYAADCDIEDTALSELERRHAAWCAQVDEERARNADGGEVVPF